MQRNTFAARLTAAVLGDAGHDGVEAERQEAVKEPSTSVIMDNDSTVECACRITI